MGWYAQLIGLFTFFLFVNTLTVSLRLYTRIKLTKGAFGWDDVVLIFTHVGMVLFVGLSLRSLHYGRFATAEASWYDETQASTYYFAMCVVCFIISGTVKISVALVLYRLDQGALIRAVIIGDIILCCIWTLFTTLIVSLACMPGSLYQGAIGTTTCHNITYARESIWIAYDVFHILLPIFILRNVQISRTLKCSVIGLFSLGILAAIAAVMKLKIVWEGSHSQVQIGYITGGYKAMLWSTVEHGLSIFASSLLALRPLMRLVPKGWQTLVDSLYGSRSANSSGLGSSLPVSKKSNWSATNESSELGRIDVHNSVTVRSETPDCNALNLETGYHAEVRGSSFEGSDKKVQRD